MDTSYIYKPVETGEITLNAVLYTLGRKTMEVLPLDKLYSIKSVMTIVYMDMNRLSM